MYQEQISHVTMPTVFSREDAPWIKEQLATLPAGMREKSRLRMRRRTRKRSTLNLCHSGSRTQPGETLIADCESFARGIPQQSGDIRHPHPGYEFLNLVWGKGGGVGF
jgi:hypothetical protein